eukprot:1161275-Pelagomonas_calceolata.AAC.5
MQWIGYQRRCPRCCLLLLQVVPRLAGLAAAAALIPGAQRRRAGSGTRAQGPAGRDVVCTGKSACRARCCGGRQAQAV